MWYNALVCTKISTFSSDLPFLKTSYTKKLQDPLLPVDICERRRRELITFMTYLPVSSWTGEAG